VKTEDLAKYSMYRTNNVASESCTLNSQIGPFLQHLARPARPARPAAMEKEVRETEEKGVCEE